MTRRKTARIERPDAPIPASRISRSQIPHLLALQRQIERGIENARAVDAIFDILSLAPDRRLTRMKSIPLMLYLSGIEESAIGGNDYILCSSRLQCGTFLMAANSLKGARQHTLEALALARRFGFDDLIVRCYHVLGVIETGAGQFKKAEYWLQGGRKLAEKHDWRDQVIRLQLSEAELCVIAGEWIRAVELLGSLLESAGPNSPSQRTLGAAYFQAHLLLGDVCLGVGDCAGAQAHYKEINDYYSEHHIPVPNVYLRQARECMLRGEYEKAVTVFMEALDDAEYVGEPSEALQAHLGLTECHAELRNYEDALMYGSKVLAAAWDTEDTHLNEIEKTVALISRIANQLERQHVVKPAGELISLLQSLSAVSSNLLPAQKDLLRQVQIATKNLATIGKHKGGDFFSSGELTLDLSSGDIFLKGARQEKKLTEAELQIMRYLRRHVNKACDRKDLYEAYSESSSFTQYEHNALYTIILRIRAKGVSKAILRAVPRVGYMLVGD